MSADDAISRVYTRTCTSCGHSRIQHPGKGSCQMHPRGEARCACEAFSDEPKSGGSERGSR